MNKAKRWLIGVDEAGRGPLAGPVAVGLVAVPSEFDFGFGAMALVGDSKEVKVENREAIFHLAKQLRRKQQLDFSVILVSAKVIDKIGINQAIKQGIAKGFRKLAISPEESMVRLDGLLSAPLLYKNQTTIIKGDSKEKVIGLASILAKVTRDRYMTKMSHKYPGYKFVQHKGYGTVLHRSLIKQYGLSPLHRKTFCQNLRLDK